MPEGTSNSIVSLGCLALTITTILPTGNLCNHLLQLSALKSKGNTSIKAKVIIEIISLNYPGIYSGMPRRGEKPPMY